MRREGGREGREGGGGREGGEAGRQAGRQGEGDREGDRVAGSFSLNVLRHVFYALSLSLLPSSGTQYCCIGCSFSLQSEDVPSHFLSPCTDNVLTSHNACSCHRLFIPDVHGAADSHCGHGCA